VSRIAPSSGSSLRLEHEARSSRLDHVSPLERASNISRRLEPAGVGRRANTCVTPGTKKGLRGNAPQPLVITR